MWKLLTEAFPRPLLSFSSMQQWVDEAPAAATVQNAVARQTSLGLWMERRDHMVGWPARSPHSPRQR